MERGELIAGRYELLKRLGRGGMGEVWAARDRALHRFVALKLLDLGGAGHPELPQRFEREAVAAAQINHPSVVALYDRGVHEDMMFLVMEKVEGATLAEHIHAESPLSLARALEIAGGICTALVAAHEADVIHYDIKPHNVMLTPDGQVKVLDFGIAGFIQATFSVARSSQLTPAGTVEYGAPEQFLTERGDERSDLYALGCVLFAMLARQPPFTGHNALAVVRRKLDEEAPRLDSLRPDLPAAVTALVAELLQRDPGRRPHSARLVHELLQQQLAALDLRDEGTSTVVEPPPPRTRTTDVLPGPSKDGPFTISWTGKEPWSSYIRTQPRTAAVVCWIVLAAGMSGVAISLAQGPKKLGFENGKIYGWSPAVLIFSGGVGVMALVFILLMAAGRPLSRSAWSLQIGSPGIRTTGGAYGRREYRWSHVQTFAIEEVNSLNGGGLTVLLIKPMKGEKQPTRYWPAGWPYLARAWVRDGMLPVCVLGPMTDQQRAALNEALARFGHGKSDAEAWSQ
ncbi:serine/threonine-protein kinase [Streptomyces sp. NPDC014724]|uniref:serine/threonine-protein kinase n=1 Tax=unclassified Streptomyces TaxID=2593676 RepID=UPI0036FBD016